MLGCPRGVESSTDRLSCQTTALSGIGWTFAQCRLSCSCKVAQLISRSFCLAAHVASTAHGASTALSGEFVAQCDEPSQSVGAERRRESHL